MSLFFFYVFFLLLLMIVYLVPTFLFFFSIVCFFFISFNFTFILFLIRLHALLLVFLRRLEFQSVLHFLFLRLLLQNATIIILQHADVLL